MQSYDHRNKIILATDADFDHTGHRPCVSGVTAFLNGAAIAWKVRKPTTRSSNSTEAEIKACSLGVELIRALTDLYGEIMHETHGTVRTMIDSTGGKPLIECGMHPRQSRGHNLRLKKPRSRGLYGSTSCLERRIPLTYAPRT